MKQKAFLLIILTLAAAAAHCGKKGPLTLEPENAPAAMENFRIRQIGSQIELAWKFPASPGGKNEVFEPAKVTRVYVYHRTLDVAEAGAADAFIKKAELLEKLKPEAIKGLGSASPSWRHTFKNKDLLQKVHGFAVVYYYQRKRSAAGTPATIRTLLTPPPIQDLQVSLQGKVATLNWGRPAASAKEPALPAISGYHVYRRVLGAGGDADFRRLDAEAAVNEFFHDSDTGVDGEYEYQVSCRMDEHVESAPSNTAKTRIEDVFPPDIPNNLVSFTAKDEIFLTWESVPDKDLAFYRLHRKTAEKEDFSLLADGLKENFFRDKKVVRGRSYIYAVTAVDRKGNESDFSRPVRQLSE